MVVEMMHLIPQSKHLEIKMSSVFPKNPLLKSHSGSESLFLMRPKEFVAGNKESFPSVISDEEEGMQSQPELLWSK